MSLDILFARHGNTFGPADKVVWVGRETDLPLVAKGIEQAQAVAAALRGAGFRPDAIFCAGLRRTRDFAAIIAAELGGQLAPEVDARLDEIDYGAWAGLTAAEIAALPGGRAMAEAWSQADRWPDAAGWVSSEAEIRAQVDGFAAERLGGQGRILVVSSNGILRFIPRRFGVATAGTSYAMKTGHLGRIGVAAGTARLLSWNESPATARLA